MVRDERRATVLDRDQPFVAQPAQQLDEQERPTADLVGQLHQAVIRLGAEHVRHELSDRLAVERVQLEHPGARAAQRVHGRRRCARTRGKQPQGSRGSQRAVGTVRRASWVALSNHCRSSRTMTNGASSAARSRRSWISCNIQNRASAS